MRIDKKLYEAAPLRRYLHCFWLVLNVQKLYEAVITSNSLSFHNPFGIGLMKRVRYFVEVLGVRYFVEVLGQCLRPSKLNDIVHRSRTESTEKIYTVADKQDQQCERDPSVDVELNPGPSTYEKKDVV